ncbi:MAG: hypothetical protein D6811_11870 [Alphaproteobacteria bacterium]|nr:MAG: hypothetical protein D6811_11870 [Alphaproteobacteria bacterium]
MLLGRVGALCLVGAVALGGCAKTTDSEVSKADEAVNAIDGANLNDIMLTVADPEEAVAYFTRATREHPDRLDLKRGLALSLLRAGRAAEAAVVYEEVVGKDEATNEDRLNLADAYIRNGEWDKAEAQLDAIPPTWETYKRYRLEAMVADSNQEWEKADAFYETAAGMTTQPAGVYNNWGYSKLTRGDYAAAEKLFVQAIRYNPKMFTAKNNLVLARAAQGKYTLPLIRMSQTEKARLLHTMALAAIKRGDTGIARGLLEEAIDTHPQHFEEAVRTLEALNRQAGL